MDVADGLFGRCGGRSRAACAGRGVGILGPGDQVVGEGHQFEPDTVVLEVAERQVAQAGVLVVADVVLDTRAAAMIAFDGGDLAGLVGEDRLRRRA